MNSILLHRDGELGVETAAHASVQLGDDRSCQRAYFPSQWTYELCYFWALGETLEALLTSDLSYGFPERLTENVIE